MPSFLAQHGLREGQARRFLGALYAGLAETVVRESERSFATLIEAHTTPGGLNEEMHRELAAAGIFTTQSSVLDHILAAAATPERLDGNGSP